MSKQSIGVGIRVRPLLPQQQIEQQCVKIDENKISLHNNHKIKQFGFQQIFDRHTTQQYLFELFAMPLVEDIFKGYNCCLIAYGQNKSGKTYTICGKDSEESKGMIPRIVDHITCKLHSQQKLIRRIIMRVSYIQIFQQEIIDLLSIRKGVPIAIIESKDKQIYLKNLEIKSINKIQEIQNYFILGNRKRDLAYSKKYRSSELSSTIFTIYYQSLDDQGKVITGKLDIVQFQANQRINRFQAAISINSKSKQYDISANSFKNVIVSLIYGHKNSIIPYNDSKITKILRNALGGNTKTKIIFHIFPITKCYEATLSTLRIASASQLVQNTPTFNFAQNSFIKQVVDQQQELNSAIQSLKLQINTLQQQDDNQLIQHHEPDEQNQFLSNSVLLQKLKNQRIGKIQKLQKQLNFLEKKLQNNSSIFFVLQPPNNKHQLIFFRDNYLSALQRLNKNNQIINNPISLFESSENWANSQTSFKKLNERQRFYKQQTYDLQRQFQLQRQLLLQALRQTTQKYKFYEKVAERAVKKQQIDLLKMNSKYDQTKQTYQIPLFAIRDKKISHASRFFSPQQAHMINSRAISQRKFMMTQLSSSKLKSLRQSGKQHKDKIIQIKQVQGRQSSNQNPYFYKIPKIKKQDIKKKQDFTHRMSQDQYQIFRSSVTSNRLKRKSKAEQSPISKVKMIKSVKPIISPRFRFK